MKKTLRLGSRTAITVLIVTVTLSGCGASDAVDSRTPPTDAPATSTSGASPTASSDSTYENATPSGEPVGFTCADLLSVQDLYRFNPNFSLDDGAAPQPGTSAEKIVQKQGVSCRYLNLSSGETIILSVGKFSSEEITAYVQETAQSQAPIDAYGNFSTVGAFYANVDGVGTVDLFSNNYWVSATSSWFVTPDDALKFLDVPLTKLG
jgi:hypothetical protein